MSGILLPGQDKEPKSEGGIELPKGFARTRDAAKTEVSKETKAAQEPASTESPPPPVDAASAAAAQAAPPAGTRGRPTQLEDLLFPPRGAQIRCPSCGETYVVPVFTIVDLGANPELRAPLLGGQINVAACPGCGAGGPLGAPLMVHDPDNKFLGVYMPFENGRDDIQRQKAIGDLTQALLAKIPSDQRRGYMLQPHQFMDWQRFAEKLWEFEGVTPEMLRKQRDQSALLQRLLGLVKDDKAFDLALERNQALVDRNFFSMVDQLVMMSRSQGQQAETGLLLDLRNKLLDKTDVGQQVRRQQEKVRAILATITPQTTREQLLDIVVDAWQGPDGQQIVGTLAVAAHGLFDYEFLMHLSRRIDQTSADQERQKLVELRQFLLEMQEQVAAQDRQGQQVAAQQAQTLLQEVLQAADTAAALRENQDLIDETFLALLGANIQAAERSRAGAAVRRLRQVYEQALAIVQEQMPEDMRLLNQLLSAPDDAAARQILKENRSLLDKDFLEALKPIEQELRDNQRTDLADRIKNLRGQIALLL